MDCTLLYRSSFQQYFVSFCPELKESYLLTFVVSQTRKKKDQTLPKIYRSRSTTKKTSRKKLKENFGQHKFYFLSSGFLFSTCLSVLHLSFVKICVCVCVRGGGRGGLTQPIFYLIHIALLFTVFSLSVNRSIRGKCCNLFTVYLVTLRISTLVVASDSSQNSYSKTSITQIF